MLYKGRCSGVQVLARYSLLPAVDLVRECAFSTETRAWEELVRRFRLAITSAVLRAAERWCDPTPQIRDDLFQDIYFKICNHNCRMLRSFRPYHHNSIYGFLQVVAVNVVHDHFKAERSSKRRGADRTDFGADHPRAGSQGKCSGIGLAGTLVARSSTCSRVRQAYQGSLGEGDVQQRCRRRERHADPDSEHKQEGGDGPELV
jgi:DNA-directed RNA polymerase specialized sigma24 family protein